MNSPNRPYRPNTTSSTQMESPRNAAPSALRRRGRALLVAASGILTLVAATAALAQSPISIPALPQDAPRDVQRGRYLVAAMGCNDCHTPWKMGANGPEMDMTRMLSGHPETAALPAPPANAMPWGISVSATFTAWSGPWGMSYTANLTPDPETGLGKWTAADFVATMRSGRHQGRGRPLLPPMPYFNLAALTDEDIHAVFAYLQSIPPVKNRVPEPVPPKSMPK